MIEMLRELWEHQAWADARLWAALVDCAAAGGDAFLKERTLHVHHAQDAFLRFARGDAPDFPGLDRFPDLPAIRGYGREVLSRGSAFLGGDDTTWLDRLVVPPWKRDPPLRFEAGEGVLQAILHSQHHRGQNAMRLRELGGEPPTTDFILWVTEGRPAPAWD